MLLQSSMSGVSSDSGSDSFSIAPLMMLLLEQLLSNELSTTTSNTSAESGSGITLGGDPNVGGGRIDVSSGISSLSQSVPQGMPVAGAYVTQGSHTGHVALDFGMAVGTPVKTTMAGKVVYAGWNNEGYGNLVIVENGPYRTYYAHLSEIPVTVGQTVTRGSVIGLSGNTGNSTGPHLHYEIRKDMVQVNPSSATLA